VSIIKAGQEEYLVRCNLCGDDASQSFRSKTEARQFVEDNDEDRVRNLLGGRMLVVETVQPAQYSTIVAPQLQSQPTNPSVQSVIGQMSASDYHNRGVAYEKNGNYEQAIADYQRALNINPNFELSQIEVKNAKQKRGW
jgi:tetratricopeptide (TPR) repeat protein